MTDLLLQRAWGLLLISIGVFCAVPSYLSRKSCIHRTYLIPIISLDSMLLIFIGIWLFYFRTKSAVFDINLNLGLVAAFMLETTCFTIFYNKWEQKHRNLLPEERKFKFYEPMTKEEISILEKRTFVVMAVLGIILFAGWIYSILSLSP